MNKLNVNTDFAKGVTNPERIAKYVESCERIVEQKGSCTFIDCTHCPGNHSTNGNKTCGENGWGGDNYPLKVANAKAYIAKHGVHETPEDKDKEIEDLKTHIVNLERKAVAHRWSQKALSADLHNLESRKSKLQKEYDDNLRVSAGYEVKLKELQAGILDIERGVWKKIDPDGELRRR